MTQTNNPHANSVKQLEHVATLLRDQYEDKARFNAAIEKLKTPDRVIETELSIKMDDGSTKTFTAFRSQHDNARGPYKGGIRFHQDVSKEEVMALSTWMTWKCAVTGIPYGGGKGGVIVDPSSLSQNELQQLSRAYARAFNDYIGPWIDIPAPDVNTTGQIMAWMVDEIQKVRTNSDEPEYRTTDTELPQTNLLATFTGKPITLGGSAGREEATGLAGVFVLEQLANHLGLTNFSEVTVAIQGFGNVGYWFAFHAHQLGFKVVAVSDSKGGIYVENGLDPVQTLEAKQKTSKLSGGKTITNQELLELDVDILVPAALENVITTENASKIKAKAIIEMANGPTTPEADEVLHQKNILVVPDVLANAGGVTTSYFEWVQNLQGYYWTQEEVIAKLRPLMDVAFDDMWRMRELTHTDGRTATYLTAVKRVIDAMMLRGRV